MCAVSCLTRFHTSSAVLPIEALGLVYFSSCAVSDVISRGWSVPVQFSYVLPSTLRLMTFIAGPYVHVP